MAQAVIADTPITIPIDLIVPEGFAPPGRSPRRAPGPPRQPGGEAGLGLEAALVDKDPMPITALDPADQRAVTVDVAGVAALLVAKAHKLHDREQRGRADRLDDKDAADVFRMMQVTSPDTVGSTPRRLSDHAVAGPPTAAAVDISTNCLAGAVASQFRWRVEHSKARSLKTASWPSVSRIPRGFSPQPASRSTAMAHRA